MVVTSPSAASWRRTSRIGVRETRVCSISSRSTRRCSGLRRISTIAWRSWSTTCSRTGAATRLTCTARPPTPSRLLVSLLATCMTSLQRVSDLAGAWALGLDAEVLGRHAAGGPVADDAGEMAPDHRHVAPDALHPLTVDGGARPRGAKRVLLQRVPAQADRLARDRLDAQVLLHVEGHALVDLAPAGVHPLLGGAEHRRLGGVDLRAGVPVPALVVGIVGAQDDRRSVGGARRDELDV